MILLLTLLIILDICIGFIIGIRLSYEWLDYGFEFKWPLIPIMIIFPVAIFIILIFLFFSCNKLFYRLYNRHINLIYYIKRQVPEKIRK